MWDTTTLMSSTQHAHLFSQLMLDFRYFARSSYLFQQLYKTLTDWAIQSVRYTDTRLAKPPWQNMTGLQLLQSLVQLLKCLLG